MTDGIENGTGALVFCGHLIRRIEDGKGASWVDLLHLAVQSGLVSPPDDIGWKLTDLGEFCREQTPDGRPQ